MIRILILVVLGQLPLALGITLDPKIYDLERGFPHELPRLIVVSGASGVDMGDEVFYRERNGGFESYHSHRMVLRHSDACETLLSSKELFSLSLFQRIKYISKEEREELLKVHLKLKSPQFRTYELVRESADAEAPLTPDITPFSLWIMADKKRMVYQAALWSIAGQMPNVEGGYSHEKMAWQLDPEFADTELDRSRYRFTWELGRGAQNKAGSIDILVQRAVLEMTEEVISYRGNIDDGYVFLHGLGPGQLQAMKKRRHPVTGLPIVRVYAKHGEHNEVLMVTLRDMIEAFPPEVFSVRLKEAMAVTQGKMTALQVIENVFAIRDHLREDLTLVLPRHGLQASPIILRTGAPLPGWFMAQVAKRQGTYEVAEVLSQYLSSMRWAVSERPEDYIVDEHIPPFNEIARYKAIGISNLDPRVAKMDSDYTKFVLMASFLYFYQKLAAAYPFQTPQLLGLYPFIINSSHQVIIDQALAIPGVTPVSFASTALATRLEGNAAGLQFQPRISLRVEPGYSFNAAQIHALMRSSPQLASKASEALRRGHWHIRNLQAHPFF